VSKDEKELTGEAHFYCTECKDEYYLVYYHGVPVLCPDCGSTKMELDEDG